MAVIKGSSNLLILMHDFNGPLGEPDFYFKTAIRLVLLDQF
jgi:hypothetical protein